MTPTLALQAVRRRKKRAVVRWSYVPGNATLPMSVVHDPLSFEPVAKQPTLIRTGDPRMIWLDALNRPIGELMERDLDPID